MNWVLLVYSYLNGPAAMSQRFNTLESCEKAMAWYVKAGWGVSAICMEDKK